MTFSSPQSERRVPCSLLMALAALLALASVVVQAESCGVPVVEIYDEDVVQGPQPPHLLIMVNLANYAGDLGQLTQDQIVSSLEASACTLAEQNLKFEGFASLELVDVQYVIIASLDEYGEADLQSANRYGRYLFRRGAKSPTLEQRDVPLNLSERLAAFAKTQSSN